MMVGGEPLVCTVALLSSRQATCSTFRAQVIRIEIGEGIRPLQGSENPPLDLVCRGESGSESESESESERERKREVEEAGHKPPLCNWPLLGATGPSAT